MSVSPPPVRPAPVSRGRQAVIRLLWICGGPSQRASARWHQAMAPQIAITAVEPARFDCSPAAGVAADEVAREIAAGLAVTGGCPYAIAGYGEWALVGFELARLMAAVLPPVHLVLAVPAEPAPADRIVSCPVTAFVPAGTSALTDIGTWAAATSGPFGVRLLPADPAAWRRPGRRTLLSIKEDLRVWPA